MTYSTVNDTSMVGNNGSPIVEYLDDRLGVMWDALEHLFYVYTPTIHWHVVPSIVKDKLVRRVIEHLADEAFWFGQQTKSHE